MNGWQTVFTFFYALYFAVFTTTTGKLHPFDTASMWNGNWHAWLRTLVSVIVLNIIPLFYFYFIFTRLAIWTGTPDNFWNLILLFFLSLSGMGFYRMFYGLMLIKKGNEYFFYDFKQYSQSGGIPPSFGDDLNKRPSLHQSIWPHLGPGLIWVGISFGLAFLLIK
jgi:hypothetical protein